MQELEKILEEIEMKKKKCLDIVRAEIDPMEITIHREQYKGLRMAEDIIRKRMNDGWISVEDGLPEDGKSVLCCSDDERMMIGVLHKEYYVDFGITVAENYNQIMNDVIAWQPLPEPYRPERSDGECGAGDENNGGCAWRLKMQNRETRCRN